MLQFDGIHHIGLTVTDMDRSVDWYTRVLGLRKGWETPDVQGRGRKIALMHPESDLRITLYGHQATEGEPFSEFHTGLDHVALTVDDRAALEAWAQHFDDLGVEHSPLNEGVTGWLITFRDPDHIQFEMYSRRKDESSASST